MENKNSIENKPSAETEILLSDLLKIFWKEKLIIISIMFATTIGLVLYTLQLPNYYKSESILMTRDSLGTPSYSGINQITSLAGFKIPSSSESKATQIIQLIKSREFLKHLLSFEGVLQSLMAVESYDPETKKILFNDNLFDSKNNIWTRIPKKNQSVTPSYLETYPTYLNMMSISQDNKTGFIFIDIEHQSPVFTKYFLDLIINESNAILRENDIKESNDSIKFLKNELINTAIVDIRDSINSLIQVQLETQMLAQVNDDYVLIPIEPPFIPEIKSRPNRAIICILGAILTGLFSLLIALVKNYFKRNNFYN